MQLQIRWKDTGHKAEYKHYFYRKNVIKRHEGGWIIATMDDANIYHCIECAQNAIDGKLGERKKISERRKAHGVHVIGKR